MKGYFTVRRGRVHLTSELQHRYMHQYHLDHTHHMPDGRISRHRWEDGKFIRTIRYKQ